MQSDAGCSGVGKFRRRGGAARSLPRRSWFREHVRSGASNLCAGNGTVGYEALCKGAALVVGIEKYGKASTIININWLKFY